MDAFAAEQDYFWFLATVTWLGLITLAVVARTDRAARVPGWLVVVALAATVHALASIFLMVARRDIFATARWQDDLLLALPLVACAGALGWATRHAVIRWATLLALAMTLAARAWTPEWSSHVVSLAASVAAWRLAVRTDWVPPAQRRGVRLALLLVLGMILLSPAGSIASLIGETQRWNRMPQLGLPCAMICVAAGLAWVRVYFRLTQKQWGLGFESESERRDLRRLGWVLLLWLLVGFALTEWSGRLARQTFEQSLLAQARVGAAVLKTGPLHTLLGPQLKLSAPIVVADTNGTNGSYVESRQLTKANLAELRATLSTIRKAVPHTLWVQVMTLRGPWLVSVAFDERVPVNSGEVPIQREITPGDREAWAARGAFVTGPVSQWGMHVSGRAPIIDPKGGMLGWLAVDVPVDLWVAAQTQARAQSLLLTGAGVALGLMVFGLRVRSRERQAAQQTALEAQRAEQRQTVFLAKVSHELRTPIQNILGYAHLLQATTGASGREKIDAIRSQGSLLIRLVNDLIDLSAAQAGEFRLKARPTSLASLIAEEVGTHRARAEDKGLALHVEFSRPEVGIVECDPDRVRQVVTNLVSNAIKFTRSGWVRVAVKILPGTGGAPSCEILVADSGPGVSLEDQRRLFMPFERLATGERVEGSGLGLALCRRICRAMGGDLSMESDGATGSAFRATFVVPAAESDTVPAEISYQPAQGTIRILIAEDNTLVRRLFRAWLEMEDTLVAEAADGLEAYQRITLERPDVLVVDISMPGMDGIALARRLRAEGYLSDRLKIVGVSAHALATDRAVALGAGMNLLLLKPVEPAALRSAVLGARPPPSAAESRQDRLQQSLREEFCGMVPRLKSRLDETYRLRDWSGLARLAHELGNCAFALQERELGETSSLLEQALRAEEIPPESLITCVQAAILVAAHPATLSPRREADNPPTQPAHTHEFVPIVRRSNPPPPGRN